jgi:nucleoside-diphosphate-sugar epimerase
MQTILGSGGSVGVDLAKELKKYTKDIRLVSRNPEKVNDTDQVFKADLTQKQQVFDAIEGSDIVYVTIGFPYNTKVWREVWPEFIKNVIEGCKKNNAKLVFFDNVYMIDKGHIGNITEDAPVNPPSKKGEVRAEVFRLIRDAWQKGEIKALVARSADFYGPGSGNSVVQETILKNYLDGKKAIWLGPLKYKHSMTYTPDAARATAILGNTEPAYNQVWNMPTADDPPTGKGWAEAFAKELGVKPRIQSAPKFLVKVMGLFNPIMRELPEMMYQNDRDYIFNSSKFEKAFNFTPTPYEEGIKAVVEFEGRRG